MNKFKSPSPAKKSGVSNSHKKRAAENKNKREQNKAFKPKKTRRKIGYRRKAGGGTYCTKQNEELFSSHSTTRARPPSSSFLPL